MAKRATFTWSGLLLRFLFALLLVFATYNPWEYSLYRWVIMPHGTPLWAWWGIFGEPPAGVSPDGWKDQLPIKALVFVVLLIGWIIYLRATWRSLGAFGVILALAFFATLLWLLVAYGGLALDSGVVVVIVAEVIISAILAVGMSWSLIRRRLTGQLDVDEIGDESLD